MSYKSLLSGKKVSSPTPASLRVTLERAQHLVYAVITPTPQLQWALLSERVGTDLWVKHENHNPTGSFKLRGGVVYLDWLRVDQPETRGVIAATRGNFGQSVAFAAR